MNAIVSVIGKDRTGIIAKVTTKLYELDCNVEDISQTVMHGSYFTMIMLVTLAEGLSVNKVNEALHSVGEELGVEICVRHEDVFNSMHRI